MNLPWYEWTQDPIDDKWTLVHVMAWCCQAASHCLNPYVEYVRVVVVARPPSGNYSTVMTLENQMSTNIVMLYLFFIALTNVDQIPL